MGLYLMAGPSDHTELEDMPCRGGTQEWQMAQGEVRRDEQEVAARLAFSVALFWQRLSC